MNIRLISIILVLGMSAFVTGCATIASGTTQEVTFQSTPDGATVKVNGKPLGKTPLTVQLDKNADQTLTFEKEGYKTFSTAMTTTTDGWFWGNIIIGGLLGSTTDMMSGAINEYAPSQYIVTLQSESVTQFETGVKMSKRENARQFLFVNYEKLQMDLSRNGGETLDSALFMLDINADDRTAAIDNIKDAMFSQQPAEFVDQVLNKYLG